MKTKMILSLIVLSYASTWCSLAATFTDAGQGNSTLVLSSDPTVPALLVDCGSKGITFKGPHYQNRQIDNIATQLRDHAQATKNHLCIIVVSHPDEDHYNWIKPVIKAVKKINSSFKVQAMYLGGAAHFYAQSFQKFLTELATDSVYPTTIVYPTDTSPLTAARELFSLNTNLPRYSLLPALQCTNKKESNDASLVVMVEQGTEIGILTGDATKKTTDHIMAYHPRFTAKLLQASHHGAADEGCNDQAWIQWLNPSCIIMSSGLNFSHPRESVVKSLLSLLPTEAAGTPFHSVAFGEEDRSLQSATSYERGYHLVSTDKKLFGTLRHGTISVVLSQSHPPVLTYAGGIPGDAATKNISSLEGSLSRSPEVFSLHNVREINLSGLGISDNKADEKDTLITLLKTLKATHSTHLYALILADTTVSQQDTADALTSLIQSNKNIARTTIPQAPLPAGTEQAIIHAWNNRGLEFLQAIQ